VVSTVFSLHIKIACVPFSALFRLQLGSKVTFLFFDTPDSQCYLLAAWPVGPGVYKGKRQKYCSELGVPGIPMLEWLCGWLEEDPLRHDPLLGEGRGWGSYLAAASQVASTHNTTNDITHPSSWLYSSLLPVRPSNSLEHPRHGASRPCYVGLQADTAILLLGGSVTLIFLGLTPSTPFHVGTPQHGL
jgi:hypothetical protein